MLIESGAGTEQDIARAREEAHGLGLFVHALVGLDREAATAPPLVAQRRLGERRPDGPAPCCAPGGQEGRGDALDGRH
jgi:hypothetical protein